MSEDTPRDPEIEFTGSRRVGRAGQQTPTENEPEEKSSGRELVTMEEQGDVLPIGILGPDKQTVHRDLVTKPWKTKEERELGKLVPTDAGMAEHVTIVVGNMCSRLGPYDLDKMDAAEKEVAISSMYMGDVFYAYCWLRYKRLASKLHLIVSCPKIGCGVEFPYSGDLGSIEVMRVKNIDDIIWTYTLHDPIELRGKEVTSFVCAYPKWSVLTANRGNTNEADVAAFTIQSTVVSLNDDPEPMILAMSEIDELSKEDFELMKVGIDTNFLGPKMAIEGKCDPSVCKTFKRGGHEFIMPINWAYKDFFGSSSLKPR